MLNGGRSRLQGAWVLAGLASVLYMVLAVGYVRRFADPELNSSARSFFLAVVVMTVVLYAIAVVMAMVQRRQRGAPVPVIGAALFGALVCVFFVSAGL